MVAKSDKPGSREHPPSRLNIVRGAGPPDDQSVFNSTTTPKASFAAAARLETGHIMGTVGAKAMTDDERTYGAGSDALLSDAPLGHSRPTHAAVTPALRESLIAELREISGQVNRMMVQVDRAIHRLGEHTGTPIRR